MTAEQLETEIRDIFNIHNHKIVPSALPIKLNESTNYAVASLLILITTELSSKDNPDLRMDTEKPYGGDAKRG